MTSHTFKIGDRVRWSSSRNGGPAVGTGRGEVTMVYTLPAFLRGDTHTPDGVAVRWDKGDHMCESASDLAPEETAEVKP